MEAVIVNNCYRVITETEKGAYVYIPLSETELRHFGLYNNEQNRVYAWRIFVERLYLPQKKGR